MILFYHGADGARIAEATEQLVSRYRTAYATACSLYRVDAGAQGGLTELERVLKYPSFFRQPALVVIRNAFPDPIVAKELTGLLRVPEAQDKETVILIRQEGTEGALRKSSKQLWELLGKTAKENRLFEPLSGSRLTAWMKEFCAARGCTLNPASVPLLTALTGTDSWLLMSEMEKLCAWQGTGIIGPDAVRLLTYPAGAQSSIFALTDALANRDKRNALNELDRQLSSGTDPHYLLSMYAFAIRNILAVKDLADRGTGPAEVAAKSGLHPFVAKKTLVAAGHYDAEALRAAHRWLWAADRATKNGGRDATDTLYDFLLSAI